MAQPTVTTPSVEQHESGFGIGVAAPRLSWRFEQTADTAADWEQAAYEVEVERDVTKTRKKAERYSVASSTSVLVPWPSRPLQSREQARVRVRVSGSSGEQSEWSPWREIEAGLLQRSDWTATPIAAAQKYPTDLKDNDGPLRPVRFRRVFDVSEDAGATKARLYITSLGVYKAYLNGQTVGDQEMAPGWTSYRHRLNYQVYDVGALVRAGQRNELEVEVAEGWYAGRLGFGGGRRYLYGDTLGLLAQLEVGDDVLVTTGEENSSWKCRPSAVLRSEIYDGEVYDAGAAAEVAPRWDEVKSLPMPMAELVAPDAPPVRVTQEVKSVAVLTTPSGKTVVDFGQNLVGRLRVRGLSVPEGESGRVTFRHAEVLEDGELGVRPLRVAACTDTIVFPTGAQALLPEWSPCFTFHGFRYVQVEGWPAARRADELLAHMTALVLHTDMKRTGYFKSSHSLINQLHANAVWSMRGNFLSVPTDCPQRDERLGWTGDIQVFAPSACFLYDTAGMLGDWLRDVRAEHLLDEDDSGIPPFVVPNVIPKEQWPRMPMAVWDDVTVLTPWDVYRAYGDVAVLQRQYASMEAWLDRGVARGPDRLWDPEKWQLGDWLDPAAPPENPGDARTSGTLVADAYLVHVTEVMAAVAGVLGTASESGAAERPTFTGLKSETSRGNSSGESVPAATAAATQYASDAAGLRAAFQHKYIAPSGLLVGDTQTALSLALVFGLHATAEQAASAAERLVRLVRAAKFCVATGFAGTPIVTHALSVAGHHQVAYRMLQETQRPSWLYPVTMGATTVWERWDSMLPDGSINPGEMTSFNHYALGSVVHWLHTTVAGLSPLSPGWKTLMVAPLPGGTISSAEATFETVYGRLESRWTVRDDGKKLLLDVLVPPNTRAWVVLPHERVVGADQSEAAGRWIGSGHHHFESVWDSHAAWPPKALLPPMTEDVPTFA